MNRYTGMGSRCAKCNSVGATSRWRAEFAKKDGTCGYGWRERPVDADATPEEP